MQFDRFVESLHKVPGAFYEPFIAITRIILIIVLAVIAIKVGRIIIKKFFEKQKSFRYRIDSKRIDTMSTLMVSIFRYSIYTIAGISILAELTIRLKLQSVMTAAGIGGIALGFGAQSLIKDVISGFFIVMEDQYVVGDTITIDNMTGNVEEMELRVTKLRNFNGDLYIIPNGEIKKVTNHTRGNKAVIVDIPVAYGSDIKKAVDIAAGVCNTVSEEFSTIVEQPKVLGITAMDKDGLNLRIMAKTLPNEQWEVERRIRRLVKEEFGREGVEFFDKNKIILEDSGLLKGGGTDG